MKKAIRGWLRGCILTCFSLANQSIAMYPTLREGVEVIAAI
jgi:hypothetical protein